jgi:hypothetical protein
MKVSLNCWHSPDTDYLRLMQIIACTLLSGSHHPGPECMPAQVHYQLSVNRDQPSFFYYPMSLYRKDEEILL